MTILGALFLYLVARVTWSATGAVQRGAQRRGAQLFSHRPLLGRWSSSVVEGLRALAAHGPDALVPRTGASLSSPYPACCAADLESADLRSPQPSFLLALPALALVTSDPDSEAFVAGVQLGIAVAFIVVAAFLGVSIVRRMLGS